MKSITLFVQTAILWVVSLVVAALGGAAAGALGVFYLWTKDDEKKAERETYYGSPVITRRFDNESKMWTNDLESIARFVYQVQDQANEWLNANGHIFLNDVYDMLGLRRTHQGQLVGWNESRVIIAVTNPTDEGVVDLTFLRHDGEIWDDEKTWTKLWPEG